MEVSGKRKDQNSFSASRGSAEDFVLICIPCDSKGARVSAYGYCKNCQEHLCKICFKHHKKPALSRNHVLLNKDSMPKTPSVSNSQEDFDSCHTHEDKKLDFYCRDHSTVVCSICVTLEHKVCKVENIPKLSKNILRGSELQDLVAEMKDLKDVCRSRIKKAKENMKSIAQSHEQVLQEIRRFRKELNTRLDEMELSVTKETDSLVNAQQKRLEKLSVDLEEITKEIVGSEECLDSFMQRNRLDKLFVEMKKAKKRFTELAEKERDIDQISELHTLEFVKNQTILEMLQSQKQLGKLNYVDTPSDGKDSTLPDSSAPSADKTVVLELVGEISVKSSSDENKSSATGMEVVQPDKIVICDVSNKKVKCYNTVQNKIVSEVKLDREPFDVADISDNKVAVTITTEKSIYIMSLTSTSITFDRRINVNEKCQGIAYSQDKLVVSCDIDPGKVLIIDLNGKILQRFCRDNLFSLPCYITVNTAGTYIYVSDCGYPIHAVKQLDWEGNIVNFHRDEKNGTRLGGLCELDDGTFLVCLSVYDNDNIVRMSNNCKTCKVTGHEKLGVWFPAAVTYCKKTRRLYVSYSEVGEMLSSYNLIKVFRVGWC